MPGTSDVPLLIKGGRVVNDDCMFDADVVVEHGIITHVGKGLQAPAGARVIDATGKMVIPGGIDPHTHLQLPVMGTVTVDDFYIGTKAALAGGTTMVIDFIVPDGKESLVTAYDRWRSWADPKVCCDYSLSCAVTKWDEHTAKEMETLTTEKGVNSFKFYMAYKNMIMIRDDDMYQAFHQCRKLGAIARVHAENGDVIWEKQQELLQLGITGPEGHTQSRPEELEAEATNRACVLAGQANCPLYVVHVTTKGAAETIALHRLKGTIVIGEATAAAVSIDGRNLYHSCWLHAAAHVSSPPLSQDSTTPAYLMDLFSCGQLQLTGSDNCTYSKEQRKIGKGDFTKIPNGVNGLEDRMSVVWEKGVYSGKLDPMRFVAITSTAAAKIFNIYPKKGRIAVGSDADIVVWDPNTTRTISVKTHHQATDFNVFEGMEVHGVAVYTITRGHVAWENGKLHEIRGSGKFVPLPSHSPVVFGSIEQRALIQAPRKVHREDE